jgi:AcrR family transcriptional regulator
MQVNRNGERGGSLQAERSQATRTALLETARSLFAERGYAAVGTEEIVRTTGVTRGALYHHFEGKLELFAAVYEGVEEELMARIAAAVVEFEADDPLGALEVGAQAFLDAAESDRAVQRIALVDAPSVLGWERWREIGMRFALGMVQATLEAAIAAEQLREQPVGPLAHLLLGAIDEGAMLIARSEDGGATRRQVGESITRMLAALAS